MPPHFVAFAHDGGGNYHGFDVRSPEGPELEIDFYDHKDPELDSEPPAVATSFADWLEQRLGAALEQTVRRDADQAIARFQELLGAQVAGRFTPTE